eukprot:356003-Chlamydomonas_euryale.AAC.10
MRPAACLSRAEPARPWLPMASGRTAGDKAQTVVDRRRRMGGQRREDARKPRARARGEGVRRPDACVGFSMIVATS